MFAPKVAKATHKSAPITTGQWRPHPTPHRGHLGGRSWDLTGVPAFSSGRPAAVPAMLSQLASSGSHASAGGHGKDRVGGFRSGMCGCASCSGAGLGSSRDVGRDAGAGAGPVGAPAAPAPAAVKRTVNIFAISLPGSSRSALTDITRANTIWGQCQVAVSLAGGMSWVTDILDQDAPTGVLNEYSSPGSPTAEETAMLAYQPGGASAVHAYFVPGLSAGSRGEAFWPAAFPKLPGAVVISDSAAADTFAHELGHVLMDDGGHHADPDNLMASGSIRNVGVDKLDATDCARV